MKKSDLQNLRYKLKKPVTFIGPMGAGKTHMGQALAKLLDVPFIDSDNEIEAAARATVSEIFEFYGEESFRDGERRVLRRLLEEEDGVRVIATGGGCVLCEETRQRLKSMSYCVRLKADIETLFERVSRTKKRPLLQKENPKEILDAIVKEREALYADSAHIEIDVSKQTARQTLSMIAHHLLEMVEGNENTHRQNTV